MYDFVYNYYDSFVNKKIFRSFSCVQYNNYQLPRIENNNNSMILFIQPLHLFLL